VMFEEFAYVAARICEEKSGDRPVYDLPPHPSEPAGEGWAEDEVVLRTRWPKLFGKYWSS
jgi:hypothetical protein